MLLKKTLEISLKIKRMFRFICKRRWPHSYHYQITTDAIHIKREKAAFYNYFGKGQPHLCDVTNIRWE